MLLRSLYRHPIDYSAMRANMHTNSTALPPALNSERNEKMITVNVYESNTPGTWSSQDLVDT